jgi:hypothetical protein
MDRVVGLGALSLAGLVLVACSAPPEEAEAPPVLANALGARDFGPKKATPDDPRELLTYDYEPFVQSGLNGVGPTLEGLVRELLEARSVASEERRGEVTRWGHVLVVRAEPKALKMVRSFLRQLELEKIQPIAFDVHLVAVAGERLAFMDADEPSDVTPKFMAQLERDLSAGKARTLVRRRMRLTPGMRQSVRETTSRRPVVRIAVDKGLPSTEQETVEDGLAVHATCWLASGGYAMAHLEFALQLEAPDAKKRTLAASFHPLVENGAKRPAIEAAIDLPRLRLIGFRSQVRLVRGRWQAVAAGPAVETGQRVLALVRATWAQSPSGRVADAAAGHQLRSLRVALLQRQGAEAEERAAQKSTFFGSSMLGGRTKDVLNGLSQEYSRQQLVSVSNDIGFGRQIIGDKLAKHMWSSSAQTGVVFPTHMPPSGWTPLLPAKLDEKRRAFESVRWGRSTRLLMAWDQLHVIQAPQAVARLESLVGAVEAWRNRPLKVRAEWVEITQAEADTLRDPARLVQALPDLRQRRVVSPYFLSARSGAWTELSLTESEAVLWGFFGDDRPSPEIRFVPRGSRLSIRPRRYGSGRVELRLRFVHDEAESLAPVKRAQGLIHKPESRRSRLEQVLTVTRGQPQLLLAGSVEGRVRALVVTCWD